MFLHNINPVALTLGPLEIRYYGLVYFIGFIFAYFYLRHQIKKSRIKHLKYEDLDTYMIYFMLGSIIGARVLDFVFYNPQIILTDPAQLIKVWQGGMSIHGGIIGAMLAGWIFTRKRKVKFYELADQTIIPLMIFLGLGRIANFINGELWGTPTTSNICIDYSQNTHIINPPEGCRHPYQLYESIKNFAVGISLLIFTQYKKLKQGLLFWWGILLYNILRFFIDFYREQTLINGLGVGQYLCIIFSIISIICIIKIEKEEKNKKIKHK
ncbi:MAG: prolipoprotein diacylglyceryl transferase [Candidatus Woesearchaeota archaeon]